MSEIDSDIVPPSWVALDTGYWDDWLEDIAEQEDVVSYHPSSVDVTVVKPPPIVWCECPDNNGVPGKVGSGPCLDCGGEMVPF